MRARSAPLPRSISSIDTSDSENERKKWKRNIRREFESRFFAIVASLCLQNMNSYEVAKNIVLTIREIYGSSQWHNFLIFLFFFCLPLTNNIQLNWYSWPQLWSTNADLSEASWLVHNLSCELNIFHRLFQWKLLSNIRQHSKINKSSLTTRALFDWVS